VNADHAKVDRALKLVQEQQQILTETTENQKKLTNEVIHLEHSLRKLQRELHILEDELSRATVERTNSAEILVNIRAALTKARENTTAAADASRQADLTYDMAQMTMPLHLVLKRLEQNEDMLDKASKAELKQARIKFNALKLEHERQHDDLDF